MVAWGANICLFYETKEDLLDTLTSYCKAGLESEEYCLWLVAEPLTIEDATDALEHAVPDLDRHLADSRLEIAPASDWFLQGGAFDGKRVTAGWYEKLARGSDRGYPGVRSEERRGGQECVSTFGYGGPQYPSKQKHYQSKDNEPNVKHNITQQ